MTQQNVAVSKIHQFLNLSNVSYQTKQFGDQGTYGFEETIG